MSHRAGIRTSVTAEPSRLAIAGLTLIALLLGLYKLGEISLGTDEGVTWALTGLSWPDLWTYVREVEPNFGLYYLSAKAWSLLAGQSELAMRLPSALFYAASVPVVAAIARRLADRNVMVVAGVFATVHVTLIEYAQEARSYSLVVLACSLSALLLLRAVERPNRGRWAAWSATAIVAGYAHTFGAIAVLSQVVGVFVGRDAPRRQLLAATTGVLLVLTPLMVLVAASGTARIHTIPELSWPVVRDALGVLSGRAWPESVLLYGLAAGAGLLATQGRGRMLLFAWLAGPAIFALLASLVQPLIVPRYLLVSLPALVILAAIGLSAPRQRPARAVWGLALLAVLIAAIPAWYSGDGKPDYKGASAVISDAPADRDLVITGNGYWALRYYYDGPLIWAQGGGVASEAATRLRRASRVWVVRRTSGELDSALAPIADRGGRELVDSWELPMLQVLLYSRSRT